MSHQNSGTVETARPNTYVVHDRGVTNIDSPYFFFTCTLAAEARRQFPQHELRPRGHQLPKRSAFTHDPRRFMLVSDTQTP